jgi:hypothetical protein
MAGIAHHRREKSAFRVFVYFEESFRGVVHFARPRFFDYQNAGIVSGQVSRYPRQLGGEADSQIKYCQKRLQSLN